MNTPAIISLGSNRGDRGRYLREAVRQLGQIMSVVRVSSVYETDPVDSPPGSPPFLNLVVLAFSPMTPLALLDQLLAIETRLGRRRRKRNEPRPIDLDLILFGPIAVRSDRLTLPHPRYRFRNFVLEPMRELRIDWIDPVEGSRVTGFRGRGRVRRVGSLY